MNTKYFMLGMCIFSPIAWSNIIYGIDKIKESPTFPVYVQMGSYTQESSAQKMMREIRAKHSTNVVIKPQNQHYKVLAGPFVSKHELMQFYHRFHPKPQTRKAHRSIKTAPIIKGLPISPATHPLVSTQI